MIAQRYETSLPLIGQISDVLDDRNNMIAIREKFNRDCDQVTVRVEILTHFKTTPASTPGVDVVLFKVSIADLNRQAFLMVKTYRSKVKQFLADLVPETVFVADRIKLMVNIKGELVLTTTSSTVFREENDESDISMELS